MHTTMNSNKIGEETLHGSGFIFYNFGGHGFEIHGCEWLKNLEKSTL